MSAPRAAVSASPGGSPAALGPRTLATAAGASPRRFREVLYLHFAADGLAEEIALDQAATVLRARFEPRDYDALHPGDPFAPAAVHGADGALVVELDAPRRLLSVRLAANKAPSSGFSLLVHRLDGQAVAEKPTSTSRAVERARPAPRLPGGAFGQVSAIQPSALTFAFDFTDARFALRLQSPEGGSVPLAAADLLAVQVRADAGGARIGIAPLPEPARADADSLASPALVWPSPGELVQVQSGEVDAGQALAEVLARHLAGLPAPLPAGVDLALVIAADAPCQLDLQAVEVPYRLIRRSLASGAVKEVVRFAGSGAADRPVVLRLPGGATVTAATLKSVPSLRGDHRVFAGAAGTDEVPGEQAGVRIDGGSWVAQELTPPRAVVATGVAIGLLTLAGDTELTVQVREDHEGAPAGRKLVQGALRFDVAGRRLWATLFFPAPVILPARACWLLATATRGEAVWLARAASTSVRLLGRPAAPAARQAELDGLATLYRLLAADEDGLRTPTPDLLVAGTPVPAVAAGMDGKTAYDLTAALNAHLSGAVGPAEVPLTFTSGVPGTLTVYPPRVEYEPPGLA